ncbi:MAG: DUF6431 domain-containing protein [Mycobacteriales bacterium]
MAIVWPCSIPVESYAAAGRGIEVPVASCPSCAGRMAPWSGYWRFVRHLGGELRIFVPRGRCGACACTHALLPGFCLRHRLDTVETIGAVLEATTISLLGVRPVAAAAGLAHTTARGWVRRFAVNGADLAVSFAALAVELGGPVALGAAEGDSCSQALGAIAAAWRAAMGLPGWLAVGRWRFASSVCGGTLLAINKSALWMLVGSRRLMPPALPRGP